MRSSVGGCLPNMEEVLAAARGLMMYIGQTTRLTGIFLASCCVEIMRSALANPEGSRVYCAAEAPARYSHTRAQPLRLACYGGQAPGCRKLNMF